MGGKWRGSKKRLKVESPDRARISGSDQIGIFDCQNCKEMRHPELLQDLSCAAPAWASLLLVCFGQSLTSEECLFS